MPSRLKQVFTLALALMLAAATVSTGYTQPTGPSRSSTPDTHRTDAPLPTEVGMRATFTVTKTADTNDGTCDADCSLREAITAANADTAADTIEVPAGTYTLSIAGTGEDANATGDLDVLADLTITGAGMGDTIIDANDIDRVMHSGSGSLTLEDLTLTNGNTSGHGGGLLFDGTDLTLTRVALTSNTSVGIGGGLLPDGSGTLVITESVIIGNTANSFGGGMQINQSGTTTIRRSTISNNTAEKDGGGIDTGFNATDVTITNSTITFNEATTGGGGGVNAYAVSITFNNVTIAANTAASEGGVGTDGGIVGLGNSIVAGNAPATDQCAATGYSSQGGNLLQDGSGCLVGAGDTQTTQAITDILNPALADNGGPTPTHALVLGSNAVGNGDNATCEATDQRGLARPWETTCDIGAVELLPPPTSLTATTVGRLAIEIDWTNPPDPAFAYAIERSEDSGMTWAVVGSLPSANNPFTDSFQLTCETTYQYRLIPREGTISGPPSATASATTGVCSPSILTAGPFDDDTALLNWVDNSDIETGFVIERSTDGGANWSMLTTVGPNVTSYRDNGLACGTTYTYRVYATDPSFDSGYSNPEDTSTPPCNLLANPGFESPLSDWFLFVVPGPPSAADSRVCDPANALFGACFMQIAFEAANEIEAVRQQVFLGTPGAPGDEIVVEFYIFGASLPNTGALGAQLQLKDTVGGPRQIANCLIADRGSFGWQKVTCTTTATITFDRLRLTLGGQNIDSGAVWFDGVRMDTYTP